MNNLRIKIIISYSIQAVIFIVVMYLFLVIAPWIDSEPIENLKYTELKYSRPPAGSLTYSVNHGNVIFSERDTISNDPESFMMWLIPFLVLWIVLIIINLKTRKFIKSNGLSWRSIILNNK